MKNLLFLYLFISSQVFAHGMDKPGPHGGHIRMIGTIHTELIVNKSNFEVYLLDIGFKNATVKDSKVEATITLEGKNVSQIICQAVDKRFLCKLPKPSGKATKISLKVVRENYSPKDLAEYLLPLTFQN